MKNRGVKTKELSRIIKHILGNNDPECVLADHIANTCNQFLKAANQNVNQIENLRSKQDVLTTAALSLVYMLIVCNQTPQKQANNCSQQRQRFYHDQKNAAIVFKGNYRITGSMYKMMVVLLKNFREGKNACKEIAYATTTELAKALCIEANSLYINIHRFRKHMVRYFKTNYGVDIRINSIIETCERNGYRLNQRLIEITACEDLED